VEIDLTKLQADFLSVSAHKFHGPKGCGFLYVKNGFRTESLLEGGAQEKGKRAGTENVPGIVGMAAALEESLINRDQKDTFVLELRRQVAERLLSIEGSHLNGCGVMEGGEGAAAGTDAAARHAGTAVSRADRLCGNLNISFDGIEAEALLLYLDMKGVSVSAGAACSAGALEPSHVLTAMGISPELAKGTIRISLDETNTQEDAEFLMEVIPDAVARLRSMA
jgi:cysteine desulfurase